MSDNMDPGHSLNKEPVSPYVVNLKTTTASRHAAVKVDRGSHWGNPFIMESESERDLVCDLFIQYASWRLTIQPDWLDYLKGKNLACWCASLRCHADTLLRLANE